MRGRLELTGADHAPAEAKLEVWGLRLVVAEAAQRWIALSELVVGDPVA